MFMSTQLLRDERLSQRVGDVCEMNLELLRLLQEEALAATDTKVMAELIDLYCELADELRRTIEAWHEFDLIIEEERREARWKLLDRPATLRERRYPN